MEISDTYLSISEPAEGLFKDRGSRFIALAYPVEDENRIKELVDAARKEYHDARHCCYAYRLGLDGSRFRSNDDGEPSGSAGRQILGRIDSAGLSDILVIVIRYFGGVKLGIPGLINAYRSAVEDAFSKAVKIEKTAFRRYRIGFTYEQMPAVMKLVKDMDLAVERRDFSEECILEVRVRENLVKDFLEQTKKMSNFKDKLELL